MTAELPAGVLPVDKPEGPTSHDVVAMARRALKVRRIGHTGTLDPFASGLLLLCIGWATRIAEYLTGLPKTYVAVARLGVTTDTADPTGTVTGESERWRELDADTIARAFRDQVGTFLQRPPRYSAKKVKGVPLHRLARRGEAAEAPPAEVTVYELDILEVAPPDVRFRVRCSAGTSARSRAMPARRWGPGRTWSSCGARRSARTTWTPRWPSRSSMIRPPGRAPCSRRPRRCGTSRESTSTTPRSGPWAPGVPSRRPRERRGRGRCASCTPAAWSRSRNRPMAA